jgi:phosphoglycerate dehydrogenase-like enzyme
VASGDTKLRVLFPDAPFETLDVEQEALGDAVVIDHFRETDAAAVPDESWSACDAIILYHLMPMPEAVLKRATRCRILVRAGVGFDSVDLPAAGSLGIPVCNVPDYGTTDVADHAIGLMLALRRALPFLSDRLRADPVGNWDFAATPMTQQRLRGQNVGIVGLGRIGLAAARRAAAFDMPVGFYDPYLPVGQDLAAGYRRFDSFEALLGWADVVSVHTPLTHETRGLFDAAAFAAMKPGAILVNTARGPIVDIDALHEALRSGRLGGAGLDVLPQEPPDPGHPLIAAFSADEDWLRGRFYLTPHAAFACPQSLHDLRRLTGVTVREYVDSGRLRACVNEGVLASRR